MTIEMYAANDCRLFSRPPAVLLGIYVNPNFLWFTLFVGLTLWESAFTQWSPMMTILRKAGARG